MISEDIRKHSFNHISLVFAIALLLALASILPAFAVDYLRPDDFSEGSWSKTIDYLQYVDVYASLHGKPRPPPGANAYLYMNYVNQSGVQMLYAGLYDGEGRKLDGPLLIGADELSALLPHDLAAAVGSGAVHLAEAAGRHGRHVQAMRLDLQPSAAALAELALEANETLPTLRPLYLRPPDAKPQAAVGLARR